MLRVVDRRRDPTNVRSIAAVLQSSSTGANGAIGRTLQARRPRLQPSGLASRFDNGNPHGFSGFGEPIRAAISVNFGRLSHVSGLIERECQDASIKPLTWGSGPLLTKIGVFPLGCPDTLVWGARAAKIPRDRRRCPTRWLGRPEPNLAFIGGVFGPKRVHVENADHT